MKAERTGCAGLLQTAIWLAAAFFVGMVAPVSLAIAQPASAPGRTNDIYYLHKGDVVLMLGDGVVADNKIAFYGSIFYEDIAKQYPQLVVKDGKLAEGFNGPGLRFINAGKDGDTVAGGLARIDALLAQDKPTVCVVCYGIGDLLRDRASYEKNLAILVRKLKAARVDVIVLSPPCPSPSGPGEKYIIEIGRMAQEARKVAAAENVGFVDCYNAMFEQNGPNLTKPDGLHPNRDGGRIMANAIEKAWNLGSPLAREGQARPRIAMPPAARPPASAPAAPLPAPAAPVAEPGKLQWMNITTNVGGPRWGVGGVCMSTVVPGGQELVAGVSEQGLWSSLDGGANWTPLGSQSGEQIKGRPSAIVFEPRNPKVFWVTCTHGPGVYKTVDGGQNFQRLGKLESVAGLSAFFKESTPVAMLAGLQDQVRGVYKSADGGANWISISLGLPERSNFNTDPLVIDERTYLVNSAGPKLDSVVGIFRTQDSGRSWQQVSTFGTAGRALKAADGAIYWGRIWGQGLLKSTDGGKTWAPVEGLVKYTPIELPGGRLVGWSGKQLYVSTDGAKTWNPLGPPLSIVPAGLTFVESRNSLCVWWSSGDRKVEDAIWRLDLSGDENPPAAAP